VEQVLTVVVFCLVGARLATGFRRSRSSEGRSIVATVWRGIRWRHVWPVPMLLTAIAGSASLLMLIPGFSWGWWSAIDGVANPLAGTSDVTVGTVWEWVVPLVFVGLLAPALPLWAHAEERLFRSGAEHWSARRRVWKTVLFGLIHLIVGIPIGVALALCIGGAYFMRIYLREYRRTASVDLATLESTRAHTAYNAVVIALLAVVIVLTAVDWFAAR
jgi:uncharacterized membrane protein (UPF0136 family)